MTSEDGEETLGTDAKEAAERRASTSEESPSNVTRSTENLTIGGSEKHTEAEAGGAPLHRHASAAEDKATPLSAAPPADRKQATDGLSSSEKAVENQQRALESGEESPG